MGEQALATAFGMNEPMIVVVPHQKKDPAQSRVFGCGDQFTRVVRSYWQSEFQLPASARDHLPE